MWLKNRSGFPCIFSVATVALLVGGASLESVNGVTLESNGGYNILVAIDDTVEEPENFEQYFQRIKTSLNEFSVTLARATKGKFFINSAEILLPTEWSANGLAATTQSLASSDIRLSVEETRPFVDNPHICGLPGNQIQLPYTFFNTPNGGIYGESRKALLTLWARYRWGVYEEHGYPGELRFPYFYLGNQPDQWQETACSNTPLVGEYENLNGEECTMGQAGRPEEDCRFIPNPTNAAASSLMGFHWVESVTEFCDETNHNLESPNRQNLFCNYRSIWEVIRGTPDFLAAPVYAAEIPTIRFRTLKHPPTTSTLRPIFVLLDKGALDAHASRIIVQALPGIGSLFDRLRDTLLVKLSGYPAERNHQIRELLPWNTLGVNREEMITLIGDVEFGGPSDRDYSAAILRAAWEIEKMQFPTGAALIVVKAGTYISTNVQHEESIYLALSRNRIKLFAAEVTNPEEGDNFIPPVLKSLTERTGGGHAELSNTQEVTDKIAAFTAKIALDVVVPADPAAPVEILSRKFELEHSVTVTVDLRKRSTLSIQLSVPKSAKALLTIDGPQNPMVEIGDEWTMPFGHLRETHTYVHEFNDADEELTLSFACTAVPDDSCADDSGLLIISETFDEDAQDHESNRLEVSVTTSAEPFGNFIDFQETPIPFAIYAKVELDGSPVGNARVIAAIYFRGEETALFREVELLDNGLGSPDVLALDGIYSATFVPPANREYTFSVRVTSPLSEIPRSDASKVSNRLLPVDQTEIVVPGCGESECESVNLAETVSVTRDLPTTVTFENVEDYPGLNEVEKIMDFVAERSISVPNQINFRWTSPRVVGTNEKASRFIVFGAGAHSDLVENALGDRLGAVEAEDILNPGEIQTYSLVITNPNLLYFAVQSFVADHPLPSRALSAVSRIYTEEGPARNAQPGVSNNKQQLGINAAEPLITSPLNKMNPAIVKNTISAGVAESPPLWHTLVGIALILLSLYWEWGS